MTDRTWLDRAACRGLDPKLFHPGRGKHKQEQQALAVCRACPVRQECLDDALEHERDADFGAFGIRGGLLAIERQVMLGRRKPRRTVIPPPPPTIKHGTHAGYIAHIKHGIPPCVDCRYAMRDYRRAYRAAKRARRQRVAA